MHFLNLLLNGFITITNCSSERESLRKMPLRIYFHNVHDEDYNFVGYFVHFQALYHANSRDYIRALFCSQSIPWLYFFRFVLTSLRMCWSIYSRLFVLLASPGGILIILPEKKGRNILASNRFLLLFEQSRFSSSKVNMLSVYSCWGWFLFYDPSRSGNFPPSPIRVYKLLVGIYLGAGLVCRRWT